MLLGGSIVERLCLWTAAKQLLEPLLTDSTLCQLSQPLHASVRMCMPGADEVIASMGTMQARLHVYNTHMHHVQ
jgi:hypothetical protein